MRFYIEKNKLNTALQIIKKAVMPRSINYPIILKNVYLRSEHDTLKLEGNNLEIAIRITVPTLVEEEGAICLPCDLLSSIVEKIDGNVEITTNKSYRSYIKSGNAEIELQGENPNEFPLSDIDNVKYSINLSKAEIIKTIKQITFAASMEDIKQVLTGILFNSTEEKLDIVAVDGHRLAMMSLDIPNQDIKAIVPAKSLKILGKILTKITAYSLDIAFKDNQAIFYCNDAIGGEGEMYFVTRLLQGEFPNYTMVIPKDFSASFKIARKEFLSALNLLEVIEGNSAPTVVLSLMTKENIEISTMQKDIGFAKQTLPAEVLIKEGIRIGFNPKYLTELLNNLDAEEIVFNITNEIGPAMITTPNNETYRYIVMPIKL